MFSNETYTAVALRQESVVYAETDGYIHYYTSDVSKVGKKQPGVQRTAVRRRSAYWRKPRRNSGRRPAGILSEFAATFDADQFAEMNSTRSALENVLLGDSSEALASAGTMLAAEDGLVVYTTDGYEAIRWMTYRKTGLTQETTADRTYLSSDQVSAGDPVYRLVTSEEWTLAISVTDRQFAKLSTMTDIKVKFLKDGQTQNGTIETRQVQGKNYAFINSPERNGPLRTGPVCEC